MEKIYAALVALLSRDPCSSPIRLVKRMKLEKCSVFYFDHIVVYHAKHPGPGFVRVYPRTRTPAHLEMHIGALKSLRYDGQYFRDKYAENIIKLSKDFYETKNARAALRRLKNSEA